MVRVLVRQKQAGSQSYVWHLRNHMIYETAARRLTDVEVEEYTRLRQAVIDAEAAFDTWAEDKRIDFEAVLKGVRRG